MRRPRRPGALTQLSPLKILTQILLLQTAYYAGAVVLILFTVMVAGKAFSLDLVLSWQSLRGDTTVGWTLGLVWMGASFVGYVLFHAVIFAAILLVGVWLMVFWGQGNIHPPSHRPLETRPRFRAYDPFHPFDRYVPVHEIVSYE